MNIKTNRILKGGRVVAVKTEKVNLRKKTTFFPKGHKSKHLKCKEQEKGNVKVLSYKQTSN